MAESLQSRTVTQQKTSKGNLPSTEYKEKSMEVQRPILRSRVVSKASETDQGPLERPQTSGDPAQGFRFAAFVQPVINTTRPNISIVTEAQALNEYRGTDLSGPEQQPNFTRPHQSKELGQSPADREGDYSCFQDKNSQTERSMQNDPTKTQFSSSDGMKTQSAPMPGSQGCSETLRPEDTMITPEATLKRKYQNVDDFQKHAEPADSGDKTLVARLKSRNLTKALAPSTDSLHERTQSSPSATRGQGHIPPEFPERQTLTTNSSPSLGLNGGIRSLVNQRVNNKQHNPTNEALTSDVDLHPTETIQANTACDIILESTIHDPSDQTGVRVGARFGEEHQHEQRAESVPENDQPDSTFLAVKSATRKHLPAKSASTLNSQFPRGGNRPQPIKWTSVDIMKILGHKLDKEQRESQETHTRFQEQANQINDLTCKINELNSTIQTSQQDKLYTQKALQKAEEMLKSKDQKVHDLDKFIASLRSDMNEAEERQTEIRSVCDDLRTRYSLLQEQSDANHVFYKDQLETAVSRANKLKEYYTNAKLELVELSHARHHIDDLQKQLKDMAGALSEEKDRSSELEQRFLALSDQKSTLMAQISSFKGDVTENLGKILEQTTCNSSQLEKVSDIGKCLNLLQKRSSDDIVAQEKLVVLEQLMTNIANRMISRFDALDENQFQSTPLETIQSQIQECFTCLDNKFASVNALQLRIDDFFNEATRFKERYSFYENAISGVRDERDDLVRSKSCLEVKVSGLEKDLKYAQDAATEKSVAVAQLQVKEDELSHARIRLKSYEDESRNFEAHLKLRDEEIKKLNRVHEVLKIDLQEAQDQVSKSCIAETEYEKKATVREQELREELRKLADGRERDLKMEFENRLHKEKLSHSNSLLELESARLKAESAGTTLRETKEQLENRMKEMSGLLQQHNEQLKIVDKLCTELEATKDELSEQKRQQVSDKTEIASLKQQLSESQQECAARYSQATQTVSKAHPDSLNMPEGSTMPMDCLDREQIGNDESLECVDLAENIISRNVEASISRSSFAAPEEAEKRCSAQSRETQGTISDGPARKQRRRIDRNPPSQTKCRSLPTIESDGRRKSNEVERDCLIAQSPDLFEFVDREAVLLEESQESNLVPESQISAPRRLLQTESLHSSQFYSELRAEDWPHLETRNNRVLTPGSQYIVLDKMPLGQCSQQKQQNAPNSSSKMSPDAILGSHLTRLPHTNNISFKDYGDGNEASKKNGQKVHGAVRFVDDGDGSSSNPPSSPTFGKGQQWQSDTCNETNRQMGNSKIASRFPGLVPSTTIEVPESRNRLKRRHVASTDTTPQGKRPRDSSLENSKDCDSESNAGHAGVKSQIQSSVRQEIQGLGTETSDSQPKSQYRVRTTNPISQNSQKGPNTKARAYRNSIKHERYDLRFKEVLGMPQPTKSPQAPQEE